MRQGGSWKPKPKKAPQSERRPSKAQPTQQQGEAFNSTQPPQQGDFESQAAMSVGCYLCGNTNAVDYGFDAITKMLHCADCTLRSLLSEGSPDLGLARLKPEFREARRKMVAKVHQGKPYKLNQEMLEEITDELVHGRNRYDNQIWMDARSLPEYENEGIYVARLGALVDELLAHR
jgi:uncharacterized protein YjhX (UPF0386 family)